MRPERGLGVRRSVSRTHSSSSQPRRLSPRDAEIARGLDTRLAGSATLHKEHDRVRDDGDDGRVQQEPGPPAVSCEQQNKPPLLGTTDFRGRALVRTSIHTLRAGSPAVVVAGTEMCLGASTEISSSLRRTVRTALDHGCGRHRHPRGAGRRRSRARRQATDSPSAADSDVSARDGRMAKHCWARRAASLDSQLGSASVRECPPKASDLYVSKLGWCLLATATSVFIVVVAIALWRPDKWTGLVLLGLFGLYAGVMGVVGTSAFVLTALVRSKRAADRAEQAASDS